MLGKLRVTISQVAREARVSTQTVSRVVNNRPDVSPETRQRVQEVIARLGYQPNAIARSLVSRRTHTLGLITADFSDYFFTQVIAGAEAEARQRGYFFMLGSTERNVQDEPEYIRLLTERQVEGILFARPSTEPDDRHLAGLLREGVPVVTTAYHLPGEALMVVDVDNVDGGQRATRRLIDGGHTRIGMITGSLYWKSVNDRSQGFRQALESAGLPFRKEYIEVGDWSYESGYDAMVRLLDRAPEITAIFAQNDRMAIGAIHALRERGRAVPEDVAMVGYDDIPGAAFCHPPLTTMRQPMRQVGALAAQLLIELIDNPDIERREFLLKTELVRRDSCGGLKARQAGRLIGQPA